MMSTDIERTKALIEMDLLDTDPEQMFDDIADIASKVCGMPIALISLIDIDRQFFKSNIGLNLREMPLEQSFCKVAIKTTDSIFIIEDARLDDRFKNNTLVTNSPHIVSYYGVPLLSKHGIPVGTLCVIDKQVNILSSVQKDILVKLSKHIEYLIELRIKNRLINDYQIKIESYSESMETFAYLAAHDLKAPIRAIDSFIKLLETKYQNIWDIKDKKYLSFIHDSTLKMNKLIYDLLEYSKGTTNIKNLEEFNLKNIIVEQFNALTYQINEAKPILICDEMPTLFSSKVAFTILFNNLINNALKYQKPMQIAVVEIKLTYNNSFWIFTVQDNGIGIEPAYFKQIFQPFKRLHTNVEFPGTGLGLAACAKIVNNLKGSINVDSIPTIGSIFTIKIPK